jgi:hypothetical protein
VHHLYAEAELVRALNQGGDDLKAVAGRLDRLALDAVELAVELQLFTLPKLESMLGMSMARAIELVSAVDVDVIDDPRGREQVAAVQALGNVHDVANVFKDLVPASTLQRPKRANPIAVPSRADDAAVRRRSRLRASARRPQRRSGRPRLLPLAEWMRNSALR